MSKKITRPIQTMTDNDSSRVQEFKNFLEKRQAETGFEELNEKDKTKPTQEQRQKALEKIMKWVQENPKGE